MTIALLGGEKYKHPSTVPVDEIYKVWMGQKKRYSIATDAELWGQKQWDDMMKKLRQMRYGNASNDSDGDFKQCRLRCAEANQAWIIEFIHEGCVVI